MIPSKRIEFTRFLIQMKPLNVRAWICGSCVGMIVGALLSLAITTGLVFLSFYIGLAMQYTTFLAKGNGLAAGYTSLFYVPAVSDAWSVFSCFLYGALFLVGTALVLGVLFLWLGIFCWPGLLVCLCYPGDDPSHTKSVGNYGTMGRSHIDDFTLKVAMFS
jgi:hypothetical protein